MGIDVAAAHGDDQVVGLGVRFEPGGNLLEGGQVQGVVGGPVDGVDHVPGVDDAGVHLPAGVDVRYQHLVRLTKAGHILTEQGLSPGVAVALEHADEPVVGHPGGRLQGGGYLVGVVAIVVVDGHAVLLAHKLEPALGVGKAGEGGGHVRKAHLKLGSHGAGGQGVDDVVGAGDMQHDAAQGFPLVHQIEAGTAPFVKGHILSVVVPLRKPIGDGGPMEQGQQPLHVLVVPADDNLPLGRHQVAKLGKGGDDFVQVLVAVQVVVVDVVHQSHRGQEGEKALHILAGFGDEQLPVPDLYAAVQQIHKATHVDGGIEASLPVHIGQHGGDGGLAVAAGDGGHMGIAGGNLAESHAPLHLGDAVLPGIGTLRVVGLDGGGVDDQLCPLHLLPLLGNEHGDTQLSKPIGELGPLPVGPGDGVPLFFENLCKAAHAAASHAD